MTSIPVPAPLYRHEVREVAAAANERDEARLASPFRRRRRTVRSLRDQILLDSLYVRHQII
jgi:hypothetical protein